MFILIYCHIQHLKLKHSGNVLKCWCYTEWVTQSECERVSCPTQYHHLKFCFALDNKAVWFLSAQRIGINAEIEDTKDEDQTSGVQSASDQTDQLNSKPLTDVYATIDKVKKAKTVT